MCVVSMVMDHKYDEWYRKYCPPQPIQPLPTIPIQPLPTIPFVPVPVPVPALPTKEEIDEFRRLLERARAYDKRNNEPDCELVEKRQKLLKLAEQLGVKIDFV